MNNSMSSKATKRLHWKTIMALGSAIWLVTSALAGCSGEEGASTQPAEGEDAAALTQPLVEGGGTTTAEAELATDDVGYLTQLGLIRGHLAVGYALYQQRIAAAVRNPHEAPSG